MKKIMHFLKLASLVASLLVLASCGGGGGGGSGTSNQLPTTGASLAIVQVDNAASPVIAAVTDNTGKEKFALIGTKDSSGAPLSVTQALYISASGDASTLTIGPDGLPANLSDAIGNKITFANFTNTTMDITLFDPAGNQIAGPITVNVDPTVLAKLRASVGTLASPSAQGAPLVSGLLGISSQDWILGAVNTMSTAYGVGGCASIILTFAGTGSFIPVAGTVVGAVVGAAGCGFALIDFAQQVKGTNNPLVKYFSVAGDASCLVLDHSECISLALDAAPHIVNTLAPPPSVPTGLTVSSVQQNQVRFYWTGSTDDVAIAGYRVYRDGGQIADVGGVLYTDLNVIPGTQYCYTVMAHDANGNSSGVSNQLCVTVPLATLFVSSTTPVSGASGVSVSSAVFTTFNEAIDTSNLNTSTFTVTGPSGLVTGTVSYNAATNSAVFTPMVNLAYAATYTATVTTGVKNLSGNPLASNYSWNFTTASNSGGGTASLGFTNLNPASVSTSTVGYQPTLTASGANFNNLTQIRFDWSGVTSGSATWIKGTATWDPSKIKVYTDDLMTLKPVVTQMNDPAGLTTWTVTLTDTAGATATKTFTVNYTLPTTTTCTPPQVLQNNQCVTPATACTLPQVLQNGACITPSTACTAPQTLVNGQCTTPTPTCSLPQVLQNGVCVTPPTTCTSPQVLTNGACVTPPPTCTPPQVLTNGACATPPTTCIPPQVLTNGVCVTPPPLPTATVSANPTNVPAGGQTTLTWSSTNATSCTASNGWSGSKATSGSQTVTVSSTPGTENFGLSCTNGAGQTVSTGVNVTVTAGPNVTLTASPTSIYNGQSSALSWTSSNASSCTASGGWAGSEPTSGSATVYPTSTTVYALNCNGTNGTPASTSTTVTVTTLPQPTATVSVNPTTVAAGGQATLTWSSTNATSCTASNGWSGSKATSGSQTVTVSSTPGTENFGLSCTNGAGQTVSTGVNVTVTAGPNVTLTASPTSIYNGQSSALSWTSSNASSCTASGGWAGSEPTSGSATVYPTSTTVYALNCNGTNGTPASMSTTVTVTTLPLPTATVSANPTTVAASGQTTLTWSSTNATSCTASNGWSGSKATSGSQTVTVSSTTGTENFGLSCTNGAGQTVSTGVNVSVTVTTTTAAPLVNAVSPTSYPADNSNHLMTISGNNFLSSSTLTFIDPQGHIYLSNANRLTFISASQMNYEFNDGSDPGTWVILVNNAGNVPSNTVLFLVQ
ncbi:MAG: Ig-like domain-containing protein [Sulfuricella sp.]